MSCDTRGSNRLITSLYFTLTIFRSLLFGVSCQRLYKRLCTSVGLLVHLFCSEGFFSTPIVSASLVISEHSSPVQRHLSDCDCLFGPYSVFPALIKHFHPIWFYPSIYHGNWRWNIHKTTVLARVLTWLKTHLLDAQIVARGIGNSLRLIQTMFKFSWNT